MVSICVRILRLTSLLVVGGVEHPFNVSSTSSRKSLRGARFELGSVGSTRNSSADMIEEPEQNIACTKDGEDMWQNETYAECCAGTFECLKEGTWNYVCVTSCSGCHNCKGSLSPTPALPSIAPTSPTPAPPPTPNIDVKALVWNVHWENKNVRGMAEVLVPNEADIIGINEFTGDYHALIHELNSLTSSRHYVLQPGSGSFIGYGTDIIFDSHLWEVVEGGKIKVSCPDSRNGDRAANWIVLQHRTTLKRLITGGTHLSYCPDGCDWTHECEMGWVYDKFEEMKARYDVPVLWMGDLNRCINDLVIDNALKGSIGSRPVFTTNDMAVTEGRTHYSGGCAIDHIVAEGNYFHRLEGGTTGQQVQGQMIAGSDHYPVFASVQFAR